MPSLEPVQRAATISRLLTVSLAALAVVLYGRALDLSLLLLGASYLSLMVALWVLAPRLRSSLAYLIALVDVTAVAALLSLNPVPGLPLWVLYAFPIASAAPAGVGPAVLASAASMAGYTYLLLIAAVQSAPPSLDLWPLAVLLAVPIGATVLTAGWRLERRQQRSWWQVLAASRAFLEDGEPDAVAAVVAERSRRIACADRVWLWLADASGGLHLAHQVGMASPLLAHLSLTPELEQRLAHGPLPLAELGDLFRHERGRVLSLRHDGSRVALLAVAWDRGPRDQVASWQRVRVLAPLAAHALARAAKWQETQDALRRESALRQMAARLSATLDQQVVHQTVVESAAAATQAAACLLERSSGRVLAGDPQVAQEVVRLSLDEHVSLAEGPHASAPRVVPIGADRALVTWRSASLLSEAEIAWLHEVAATAQRALERCAAHDLLCQEQERLTAAVEAVPAPLTVWDASGRLVRANAAARALGLASPFPGELPLAEVKEDEVSIGDPARMFVSMAAPFADGQYVACVYREITREREALRAKDELIALVGHELRTPLTSIHGYSQMMARQLRTVEQQVGQLNRLIGDLMDASRLESGFLKVVREPVDLAELGRAAIGRFRARHDGRQAVLSVGPCPPVEGDASRLSQVLDNLLDNAAKYSAPDQEILVIVEGNEEQAMLGVKDRGIGIATEHVPYLFDRFYRVPRSDTLRPGGLGLGLSIVRDLVVAHGGRVWVESPGPAKGSTFWVALPAQGHATTRQVARAC